MPTITRINVVSNIDCLLMPTAAIDGFQISIKGPTSGGQMHDQKAAVEQTFHFERSSFFHLSVLMVRTQCSASLPIFAHSCTKHRHRLLPFGNEATPQ